MLSLDFGFLCIIVSFAHLTESRVLVLSEYNDNLLIPNHIEDTNQDSDTPKRTRNSKKTNVQYEPRIHNLNSYEDSRELRSTLKPDSIAYDYVDIDKLIRSSDSAKNGVKDFLENLFVLSDAPLTFCYGRKCEGDLRKSYKKHKKYDDDDVTDWKHKKMQLPLGHMKRFQIVDNKHNSVRDPKFGSEEFNTKKSKAKKHKKNYSSGSEDSKESGSEEANSGRSYKKKHEDSESASRENWKNNEEHSMSEEVIPKKQSKKKKKHIEEPEDTKRKTIPVEETYFMQGNKIYHSNGKSKKKRDDFDKRRRLEHFMPKRYHWDPSEIHQLGYYWFNGPKGLYPEPKPLSI